MLNSYNTIIFIMCVLYMTNFAAGIIVDDLNAMNIGAW
jgi:hypothetical protein